MIDRRKESGSSSLRFWGPFVLQLVMILGGYFSLRQQVQDLQDTVNHMQTEIIELRSHAWH